MILPSKRDRNARSWSDPVVVPSDPRARHERAMHEFFFSKIYENPRARRAGVMRQFLTDQLDSIHTVSVYFTSWILNLVPPTGPARVMRAICKKRIDRAMCICLAHMDALHIFQGPSSNKFNISEHIEFYDS